MNQKKLLLLIRSFAKILTIALLYYIIARLGSIMALLPTGNVLWIPSGLALASVLLWGWQMGLGVFVGSFIVNFEALSGSTALPVATAIAAGAALQAWAGVWLIRRFIKVLPPSTVRDTLLTIGLAFLTALLSPLMGVASLGFAKLIPWSSYVTQVWTWWIADFIGSLAFPPIVIVASMYLRKQKEKELFLWPLTSFIIGLSLFAIFAIRNSEQQKVSDDLQRDTAEIGHILQDSINHDISSLIVTRAFYSSSQEIQRSEFKNFTSQLLANTPTTLALSWAPRVIQAEQAMYEQSIHEQGFANFSIFEKDANGSNLRATKRAEYFPTTFIEPFTANQTAFGFDLGSSPARMETILHARDSGEPEATTPIHLIQETGNQTSILVIMPVYRNGTPISTVEERRANFTGVISEAFHTNSWVASALESINRHDIELYLYDVENPNSPQFLAFYPSLSGAQSLSAQGAPSPTTLQTGMYSTANLKVGSRTWLVVAHPGPTYESTLNIWMKWASLLVGLMLAGTFLVFVDTRQKAEAALKRSATEYRALSDNALTGVVWYDPASKNILYANPSAAEMFGLDSPEEFRHKNMRPQIRNSAQITTLTQTLRSAVDVRDQELEILTLKGEKRHLLYSAATNKKIVSITIVDVTERVRAENEIKQLSRVVSQMADLVVITDVEGIIEYVNPAFEQLTGFSRAETEGKTPRILKSGAQKLAFYEQLWSTILRGEVFQGEIVNSKKNGDLYYETKTITPIRNSGGKITHFVATGKDITERKRSEELLRQQSEQLKILYETSQRLNRTLDLKEIYQAIRDFMSSIASNDGLIISAFDPETQLITCRAYWMEDNWLDVSTFPSIPLEAEGKGTQSIAIRTGQPMLVNDYQAQVKTAQNTYNVDGDTNEVNQDIPPDEEVTRSALIVPLKTGDKVNGVIQVMSYRLNAYTEDQLQLLESLALHIVSAEKNALLFAQVQTELKERKQAEDELIRSKEQLEATLNALPDLLFELDKNHRILDFRAPNLQLLYVSPENFIGKTLHESMPEEATKVIDLALEETLLTGHHFGSVYSLPMPDGLNWFELSISRKNEAGEPHFIVVVRDITERKRAEIELSNSKQQLEATLNALPDLMFELDEDHRILDFRAPNLKLLYLPPEELVGKTIYEYMPEEAIKILDKALEEALLTGHHFGAMYSLPMSDGLNWFELSISRKNEISGAHFIVVVRDVTERKANEETLRQQNKLLEHHYYSVEILTTISTRFISLPSTEIDAEINGVLKQLGEFEQVDRSYIFLIDSNSSEMSNTHEWCALGIEPQIENLQNLPTSVFPWWMEKLKNQEEVYIPFVSQLPPEAQAEREILEAQAIQSVLVIPLITDNTLIGFFGFDAVSKQQLWSQDSILLLKMAGNIISNALVRKQTEENVRLSERRNSALIENAPDGIALFDTEGKFMFASPSAYTIFGYSPQEIIGSDSLERVHPEDLQQLQEIISNTLTNVSKVFTTEYRFLHKNGNYRWVESTYSNLFAEPGVNAMVVNFHDVTERKLARELLQKSQDSMEMAQSIAHVGNWELNFKKNELKWSSEVYKIAGIEPYTFEPTYQNFLDAIHSDDRDVVNQAFVDAIKNHTPFEISHRIALRDGTVKFVHEKSVTTYDEDGTPINSLGTVQDITDRHESEMALRESDERFRQLAENIQEVFWLYDTNSQKIIYISPAYELIWGRTCQSLYTNSLEYFESILPEDQPIMFTALEKQAKGESTEAEYRVQRPDGTIRWVWDRGFPIFDEAGKLVRTAGVATDITNVKTTEEELQALNRDLEKRVEERTAEVRQNEATYRALFENSSDGIFLLSPAREELQANQRALDMLGYTLDEWLKIRVDQFIPFEQLEDADLRFQAVVRGEHVPLHERTFISKSGEKVEIEINFSAIRDASGKIILVQSVVRDATERKKAEETLRESEERYRKAISAADEVPYSLDYATNTYTFIGDGIQRITGYPHDEMTPQVFEALIKETVMRGDLSNSTTHESTQLMRTGQVPATTIWRSDFRIQHKAGMNRWISDSSVQVVDKSGQIIGSIGILQDITERKEAEAALRDSRDKLSAANAALEKASRLKDEFLASMSHELRTPLTGILGLSEAMQLQIYGELNEKQINALKNIEGSGRHLLELINDILDLSKIEAGKLDLQFEPCLVTDICQTSLQLVKGMAHQKKQNINFSMNPATISLRADPRRLKQMLVNLMSNAVKFTAEGGSLGLDVQGNETNKTICFSVWDKGIGIKPEDLEKLFKPFVQIDSSLARQYSGTGLGLSLVQRMAELHGGSIKVESTPGEGSRFTIQLPWNPDTTQPIFSMKEFDSGPLKDTLNIEDNAQDAEQVTRYLKQIGISNVVQPVLQGALEKAAALLPSAILLDLNMPEGSGLYFLAQLKADERTRNIPVIITSVEERRSEALKLGAIGYLVKPYTQKDLQNELEKVATPIHPANPILVIAPSASAPLILIADDNELVLQIITDFLEIKGYRVIATRNGFELLDRAPEDHPDLILVDIQMPGIDGMEVMRRLRAHNDPQVASTPIIAITALAMSGDREKCLQAGANEYMSKPIILMQLVDNIKQMLKEKAR